MRVHRLRLENFRAIGEREVSFRETGVNVVVGANEAGKSSMVEALDLVLTVPAHSKKQSVRSITPSGRDVGTTIEAEISCGEWHFILTKTFNRGARAELRVLQPTPQQLRGPQAHEKAREILQSSVDLGLFGALRLLQGGSQLQADLTGSAALARALDAAGGTTSAAGGQSPIVDAVRDEYARYYTANQGKATGELLAAQQKWEQAKESTVQAQAAVDDVHGKADRLDQLLSTQRDLAAAAEQDAVALEGLEERVGQVELLQHQLSSAQDQVAACHADLVYRQRDVADRQHYCSQRDAAEAAIADGNSQLAELSIELTRRQQQREQLVRQQDRAQEQVDRARTQVHRWRQQRESSAASERLDELTEIISKLDELNHQQRALAERIAAHEVDDDVVERARELEAELRRAREVVRASAPTVRVTSDGGHVAMVEREGVDPQAVSGDQFAVDSDLTITVEGVVAVSISPGSDARANDAAVRQARDDLQQYLSEFGVGMADGVTQLRHLAADRRDCQVQAEGLRTTVQALLNGRDRAELDAERDRLTAQIAEAVDGEAIDTDADAVLQAAEADRDSARNLLVDNDSQVRECMLRIELRTERVASEQDRLTQVRVRLDQMGADMSDEALAENVAAASRRLGLAEEEVRRLEGRLRAEGAESATIELENLRRVVSGRSEQMREIADEVNGLRIELEIRGDEALFDRVTQAQADEEEAAQQCARITERAEAARTLLSALESHRDDARARYVAPFTYQVERLGRLVFGEGVQVQVNSELEIVSRTKDGVTVEYEHLSGGAKEQLAIVTRLACAILVDAQDGVPVIIDDALGYTDPQRLRSMNAVLSHAALGAQVIVLTCAPERYRNVGGAHLIAV